MISLLIRCFLIIVLAEFSLCTALSQAVDINVTPNSLLGGQLEYANTKWKLSFSRVATFGSLPTKMSYEVEVIVDLSVPRQTTHSADGTIVRTVDAQISGLISWYDYPISKPKYKCPPYEKVIPFRTIGRFEVKLRQENRTWDRTGTLTIYDFPNTPYVKPNRDYCVTCQYWSESKNRWINTTETRTAQDHLSPSLLITLQPGTYTWSSTLPYAPPTWRSKIEIIGSPIPCVNRCDDLNPCTLDHCELGIGCLHEIDDTFTPPQRSPNDCKRQICRNGSVTTINDPAEERIPAGDYPHDCFLGATCQCDDSETPLEDIPPDPHDCIKYICRNCYPTAVPNDSEEPIDGSPDPHDCVKLVCLDGNPTGMPDKTETPLRADEICCEGLIYEKYPASEPGKQFICVGQGWQEHLELISISSVPP